MKREKNKTAGKKRVLFVSVYPIEKIGGGERWTINAYKAVQKAGAYAELYNMRMVGDNMRFERIEVGPEWQISIGAAMNDQQMAQYGHSFDTIWLHQYMYRREVLPLVSCWDSQRVIWTNHGAENYVFFSHYNPLKTHTFAEVSEFSAARSARWGANAIAAYGSVWRREIQPVTLADIQAKKNSQYVVCGRGLPHKKFEIAIAAIGRDSLDIVGDTSHDDDYSDKLRRLAKGRRVNLCGRVSDSQKTAYLKNAWGLLACSSTVTKLKVREQTELFGLVIPEALAAGTLPITSDIPPFVELMQRLGLGEYVCAQDNPRALRACIDKLKALSAPEYLRLLKAARAKVSTLMAWDNLPQRMGLQL